MRYLLTRFGVALCCTQLVVVACSDGPTDTDGPIEYITWETTWGVPGDDYANCALAVEGGVIVAGRSPDAHGWYDASAVMFDAKTGSPIWQLVYGTPLHDEMVDIAATPDAGAVLAGYSGWYDATDVLDSYFIRITGNGEVVWEGRYSGVRGKSEAFCVTVSSSGIPFVAGLSRGGPTIPILPYVEFIIKIDPVNGEVLKEMILGDTAATMWIWDMIAVESPEPGLVLVGAYTGTATAPFILKVDRELDSLLWEKRPVVEGARLYGVTATHDGSGYVAAGVTDGFTRMCLIGFDLEGNTIWSNVFAYRDSIRSDARGVAALPDGYLVAGYTCERFPEDGRDAYIVKTDLHGRVIYDTTYGWANSREGALDVDIAPQGGGYVAARTFGKGDPNRKDGDFYVIRTDPNGSQ